MSPGILAESCGAITSHERGGNLKKANDMTKALERADRQVMALAKTLAKTRDELRRLANNLERERQAILRNGEEI